MNEKTAILNVRMLGDFSITYDGRQVSFGKNTTTKAMKLLQILIYYGEQGIAREKLLNALYVREELADAANNLRVTAHRLKKMIIDAGLPEYDYIVIKKGVYRWNAPVPTVVDARKFQELYEEAQNCADTKQKEELLKQVCNMYRGEFLPEISGDEWVLLESVQYKKLYSNALKELCDGLIEKCDYEEALLFCEPACRLYPFDEWQSIKIECFLGMKRYKEAMKEYDDTAKLFFEELGISPSERLMEQFDQMSSQLKHVKPKEIQDIKQRLKEEGADELLTNCQQLKMTASDGKRRATDVATTEQLLRIIQSVPSPRAEPVKRWLAEVGRERIEETIDPEQAIDRALETYLKKGYDPDWVHQRLLSIRIRNELTDEWQKRGVEKGREFAILTDEISRAWSGMTTRQYKNLKGLKKENLRDNMSDTELVLTMLAEASTRDISKASKPVGFDESVKVAKRGGNVANVARQQLEAETGQPVITSQNAVQLNAAVTEMIEASAQVVDRQDDSKSK